MMGYKTGRRANQPWVTKWTYVKFNYGIRNGQTYKSTMSYKMGRRTNQLQDTKWADIQIKSTVGYEMGRPTKHPRDTK